MSVSPTVLAQLADLQNRVAALESQLQGVDESSQPNYLTINPTTGVVSASFSGLVTASGLILLVGPGGSAINWETAAGVVEASLTSDASGNLTLTGGSFNADLAGTFSGDLNAAGGTFSGDLNAAGGTFSGDLNAASGTFTGNLAAATGTFEGELAAAQMETLGLIIPSNTGGGGPGGTNQVSWWTGGTLSGEETGWIGSSQSSGLNELLVFVRPSASASDTLIELICQNGLDVAQLALSTGIGGIDEIVATAANASGLQSATIINSNGQSDFLQLASTQELVLQYGYQTLACAGAGWFGSVITLPYSYTAVYPFYAVSVPNGASLTSSELTGVSATGFTVQVNVTVAETVGIYWVALCHN